MTKKLDKLIKKVDSAGHHCGAPGQGGEKDESQSSYHNGQFTQPINQIANFIQWEASTTLL